MGNLSVYELFYEFTKELSEQTLSQPIYEIHVSESMFLRLAHEAGGCKEMSKLNPNTMEALIAFPCGPVKIKAVRT